MAEGDQKTDRSVERILAGTMRLLSRQGTHKLSVSDICEASGVARGTFYRYFSTKEEVLAALGRHIEAGVTTAFATAIAANPDPTARVRVVLDAIRAYRVTGGDFARMLDSAPQFTLEFVGETFPNLVDAVTDALGPALDESPPVVSGALSKRQLGDLFLRSVISMLFLPGNRADQVPDILVSLFGVAAAAGTAPKRNRRVKAKAG